MDSKWTVLLVIIVSVVLFSVGGGIGNYIGYSKGYTRGVEDGHLWAEEEAKLELLDRIPYYEPPMDDTEIVLRLAEQLAEVLKSAEINLKISKSGETSGSLHIYFEGK